MSDTVRTATAPDPERGREKDAILERLLKLLPGINPQAGDAVQLTVPGISTLMNDTLYRNLMDAKSAHLRRGLVSYMRSLIEVVEGAKQKGASLADAAYQRSDACRKTLEAAWVAILEQNRDKEQSVRWTAQFFSNLDSSATDLKDRIAFMDLSAEELCTDKGIDSLTEVLGSLADYPNARQAFGYVVVRGSSGDPTMLNKLGQRVHDKCAILISDSPQFERLSDLKQAAVPGGLLEGYAGQEPRHRHMILLGGRGVSRAAFSGRHAKEKRPVYVEASGPWFGHYLHNIKQGRPWLPPVGYGNPIAGFQDVELGLRLSGEASVDLLHKHRINPLMMREAGGNNVVVWAADTLSKADKGVQMGVGIVEMLLLRYAEYVVNKEGILNDLETGSERLQRILTEFINLNSGAGKMFRAGSSAQVSVDYENKSYTITFEIEFRQLGEKAFLRMTGTNRGANSPDAKRPAA